MSAFAPHALPLLRRAAAVAAVCLASLAVQAAEPAKPAAARTEAERAACLNGSSPQDRATCLKEVGAAQDERRRGTLDDGQQGRYDQNARQRCQTLPGDQQADCLKRANGLGEQSGSVAGGGIIKETTTVIVGAPGAQTPAPVASAPAAPASDPPAPSVR